MLSASIKPVYPAYVLTSEFRLSEEELALFDLLKKDNLSKADRERVKLARQRLLDSVRRLIAPLERWTETEQTQAEVETYVWQQSVGGHFSSTFAG